MGSGMNIKWGKQWKKIFMGSPLSFSNGLLIKHKNCLSHNLAIISSVWTIYFFGQEPCHIACLQHKINLKGRGCLGLGVGQAYAVSSSHSPKELLLVQFVYSFNQIAVMFC